MLFLTFESHFELHKSVFCRSSSVLHVTTRLQSRRRRVAHLELSSTWRASSHAATSQTEDQWNCLHVIITVDDSLHVNTTASLLMNGSFCRDIFSSFPSWHINIPPAQPSSPPAWNLPSPMCQSPPSSQPEPHPPPASLWTIWIFVGVFNSVFPAGAEKW